jgi:hypothetical protein
MQTRNKLNQLERTLPEGLLVDSVWMERHGYSTSLRSQYVSAGWLVQPARGAYKRPLGELNWEKVVVSLQKLLGSDLTVGGRTAIELQGFGHYLSASGPSTIHLYGTKLPLKEKFRFHRAQVLFKSLANAEGLQDRALQQLPGPSEWTLTVSTPERALLELLDELPRRESFHQVDMLVEGLRTLSPRRIQTLLADCKSIKVKRHQPSWLKQIDRASIDLGTGKRMLVKGGKLDQKYLITVPDDLNAPV